YVQFMKDYLRLEKEGYDPNAEPQIPIRKRRYKDKDFLPPSVPVFNAAALPPELGFDTTYPREPIPLPPTRRLREEDRTRANHHYYYELPNEKDKAQSPS